MAGETIQTPDLLKEPPVKDEFKGKVAFVTGAGSGLGRATAILMAKAGAKVGLFGRTESELQDCAKGIKEFGGESLVLVGDVQKADEIQDAIKRLVDESGGHLHLLFPNAGINGVWAPLEELRVEDWDELMSIKFRGAMLTLKFALPYLKKTAQSDRDSCAVVFCSSVNGTRMFSNTGATAYATTNACLIALTRQMALELAQSNIRVNAVCPGRIDTAIFDNMETREVDREKEKVDYQSGKIPLTRGKAGTSWDVAQLVTFLCSHGARHITGSQMWIDGGESLLAG